MEFDVFTIVAQILNFALLLFVLRRFLYQPILNAMEAREEAVRLRVEEADAAKAEAAERQRSYEAKSKELDEERAGRREAIREEVEKESVRLHKELRERVDTVEREWREGLEREGMRQLEQFRDVLEAEVVKTVRAALTDLADVELEAQMVSAFEAKLDELDEAEAQGLLGDEDPPRPLKIVTAFELGDARRDAVLAKLRTRFGEDVRIAFDVDVELVAGMELRCAGHRLGWSIDDYLDVLSRRMERDLSEIAHGKAAASAIREKWDARSALP